VRDEIGYLTVAADEPSASFDDKVRIGRNSIGKPLSSIVSAERCWEKPRYNDAVLAFAIEVRDESGEATYGYYYLDAQNELYFEAN
jgi:hypothetical protein